MAKNLRYFNTNTEYQAADLVFPSVSYVEDIDKVIYEPRGIFKGKFKAEYSDGTSYSTACDGNTTLTTGDTKPSGYNYYNMTSAIIGDCVTKIDDGAYSRGVWKTPFYNCASLTSVTIGSNVTEIGNNAFYKCSGLTSIDIPSGVTYIGHGGFQYCTSLTSIVIPSGVTTIGNSVFRDCRGLTSVTVEATTPPTLGIYVFDFNYATANYPIYVPSGSVNAYKSASGWSTYASRIQAIPNS